MNSTKLSASLKNRIKKSAQDRCGYCLSPQKYILGKLEIEHIIPRSKGGNNDESNLWLSCSLCNRYKGAQTNGIDTNTGNEVLLFNPRTQNWFEHFQWSADGIKIVGITEIGRATVEALNLNNELAVEVRRNWVLAGWHPPKD